MQVLIVKQLHRMFNVGTAKIREKIDYIPN